MASFSRPLDSVIVCVDIKSFVFVFVEEFFQRCTRVPVCL